MKKRLLCLFIACCMLFGMLPSGVFARSVLAEAEEEAYIRLLSLGLSDENGRLIEDNTFTLEDGTVLSSLAELEAWLAYCPTEEWDTIVTVDRTGKRASAEEIANALSLEYRMAEIASGLNAVAKGALNDGTTRTSAAPAPGQEVAGLRISQESNEDLLTYRVILLDSENNEIPAPRDITMEAGVFGDRLIPRANVGPDNPTALVPRANSFGTHTLQKGERCLTFEIDLAKIRELFLSAENTNIMGSHLRREDALWDGAEPFLFQCRIVDGAAAISEQAVIGVANRDTQHPILRAKRGGTVAQYLRNSTAPYAVSLNGAESGLTDASMSKTTVSGTEVLSASLPDIVDKRTVSGSQEYNLQRLYNIAIKAGVGDANPLIRLTDVTFTAPKDTFSGGHHVLYCIEDEMLSEPVNSGYAVYNGYTSPSAADHAEAVAAAYSGAWEYDDSLSGNLSKIKGMQMLRFRKVNVPFAFEEVANGAGRINTTWCLNAASVKNDTMPTMVFCTGTYELVDTTAPKVESVSVIGSGSTQYYPGDYIPIVVQFSEPVSGDYNLIYASGTTTASLHNSEAMNGMMIQYGTVQRRNPKVSNTRTFLYEVGNADSTRIEILGVQAVAEVDTPCADILGNAFDHGGLAYQEFRATLAEGQIVSARAEDSIDGITAAIDENDPAKAIVTVRLHDADAFATLWTNWSDNPTWTAAIVLDGDTSVQYPLTVAEDPGKKICLRAEISLDPLYGGATLDHTAELYLDDELYYGAYATFTQTGVTKAGEDAYILSVDRWYSGVDGTIFFGDGTMPRITATGNPAAEPYTYTADEQFYWVAADPDVLVIHPAADTGTLAQNHTVTVDVVGEGSTEIYLMAKNGSADPSAHTKASNTITVTVKAGNRPILSIPQNANTYIARLREAASVRFASNLTGYAPADGTILAELYSGNGVSGEPVWQMELPRDAASVTIPAEYITTVSRNDIPAYTLRLTATATVDDATVGLETTAYLIVRAKAAGITLTGLDTVQFAAGDTIEIGWTVENFDLETNPEAAAFQFRIEKDGAEIAQVTDVGTRTAEMTYSGSFTFIPTAPDSFKENYIVTAKAKNSADPTWSTASATITVYQNGSLHLLVGGRDTDTVYFANRISDAVTTTAPTVTGYAGKTFDGLTDAYAIAGLRSELSLVDTIAVDTSGADWSLLQDRIRWETTTGDGQNIAEEIERAVSVNYKRGSLYEPLERFTYTSYLPQVVMLLSGLRDGTNTVTATHNGVDRLTDSVQVTVERLRDRLYLFQFTPAVRTELYYTDKNGNTHTVYSNDDGSLALYEPNGIASALRTASVDGGAAYRGTFSALGLKSGEGNGAIGELYPLNALSLRLAATAEITLLQPDGTPYANADVSLRGGVYRNRLLAENRDDAYCADAGFAKNAGESASLDGKTTQIFRTDANGVLRVHMDIAQFTTANDPDPVGVGDLLEFVFELQCGEYAPELVTVNGSLTARDAMRSGDNIVTLRQMETVRPFIAAQTIDYHTGRQISVRDYTGVVGPSANYPEVTLQTTVMLWGETELSDTRIDTTVRAQETAVAIPVQDRQTVRDSSYPFSSIPLVQNISTLNADTFVSYTAHRKTSMEVALYRADGSLWQTMALPFGLVDMNAIERVEDSPSLLSLMANLAIYGKVGGADTEYGIVNTVSDGFFNDALSFLAKMGGEAGLVRAILMPTEDPTRFSGYFWTGINTTKLEDLNYDQNGISLEPSYMWQDLDSCVGQVNDTFTVSDFQAMADGSYFDDRSNLYGAASSAIGLPIMLVLEGFLQTEIRYNFDKGQWEVLTTGGGFTAGGQLEYEKTFNIEPFGIPIFTVSFKVRGGAVVDFQTAVRYAEQLGLAWNDETARAVNDYLTALRINAYFEFFGGIGHDKGYTAKIGVFGTIEINNENRFLTRNYLRDPNERDVRGQYLQLDGEAGIRMALGLGPVVTEITVVSLAFGTNWKFNDWQKLSDYWDAAESGLGGTGYDYTADSYTLSAVPTYTVTRDDDTLTVTDYTVRLQESTSAVWNGGNTRMRRAARNGDALSLLVRDIQPLAEPALTDDGSMLLHMSGKESSRVYYAKAQNGKFTNMGQEIPDGGFSGYGDSALSVDGNAAYAGAIWLRESASLDLKPGSILSTADQAALLGGLEVVASLWNGSAWTTTRLTENSTQEISPVIAVNEKGQAIAAWREVQSDDTLFAFTSDRIVYRLYDKNAWSETYTLYNGSSGGVTALTAALLSDGTASVAYSLNDGTSVGEIGHGGEIYYATIDTASRTPEDDTRVIRATTNRDPDDSPALTTTTIDGEDVFVLGWRSVQSLSGAEVQDIGLRVFDENGAPRQDFPESLGNTVDLNAFDGQFAFVRGADTVEELSLVWNDSGAGDRDNDVVRAVKIGLYEGVYGMSAPMTVAAMPENTSVNHFDAYVSSSDGTEIGLIVTGTTYDPDDPDAVTFSYTYTDEDGVSHTVNGSGTFPKESVNLYLTNAAYADSITVDALHVDYTTLAANAYVPVRMTVRNNGLHAVDTLTVRLDGAADQTFDDLSLLPGKAVTLSVVAKTGDTIRDLPYTVTAAYATGLDTVASGTLCLDYPDVGISRVQVTKEQDGMRSLLVALYNQSAVAIDNGSRRVTLGVYSDPECTTAVDGKYFTDGSADTPYTITLTDTGTLSAIDRAGYAREVSFDIGAYVRDAGLTEIPSAGVTLFVGVCIEAYKNGAWVVLPETDSANNSTSVTMESLLTRHDNLPVTTTVETASENTTTATVRIRNNSLAARADGVLVVSLLGRDGNVLQSLRYDVDALAGEELRTLAAPFAYNGDRVVARYSETENADDSNADAAVITIDGLPLTLADFDDTDTARLTDVPSGRYLLTVLPVHGDATVAVDGRQIASGMTEIRVTAGGVKISVTITAPDGVTKRTYTIRLENNEPQNPIPDFGGVTYRENFRRLTFQTNGGTGIPALSRVYGTWIDLSLYAPTRAGYTFAGWYRDAALTESVKELYLTEDTTVYAAWTKDGAAQPETETGLPFVDVTSADWFHDDVLYVYENALMNGTAADRFSPYDTATRAMMATVLWRMAGSPAPTRRAAYTDVPTDVWYTDAVSWTTENGIFKGYGDGTFLPNAPVTREQLAAIFHRYANYAGDTADTRGDLTPYRDSTLVSDWATESVRWAIGTGLLRGKGESVLDPTGMATRAEIAAILHRFLDK